MGAAGGRGAPGRTGRGRPRGRAQATLEFAFVAPLFLLCFLASVDTGLWAVQNSAEVSAVEVAARDAASGGASPLARTAPDSRTVAAAISGRLSQALFATRVVAWCDPTPGAPCSGCPTAPQAVEDAFGPRVVAVCVEEHAPPSCPAASAGGAPALPLYCGDTPTVTVRIVGFVAALVPPGFGIGEQGGELPTSVMATTHTLRFAP